MNYTAQYSQLVMPDHINNAGTLFGGQMLSWMDLAAAKVAYQFLKNTDEIYLSKTPETISEINVSTNNYLYHLIFNLTLYKLNFNFPY